MMFFDTDTHIKRNIKKGVELNLDQILFTLINTCCILFAEQYVQLAKEKNVCCFLFMIFDNKTLKIFLFFVVFLYLEMLQNDVK